MALLRSPASPKVIHAGATAHAPLQGSGGGSGGSAQLGKAPSNQEDGFGNDRDRVAASEGCSGSSRRPAGDTAAAGQPGGGESLAALPALAEAGPGPGSIPASHVRTLQECCCRVILRHISVHNCLELLAVCGACGRAEAPALAEIAEAALRYAAQSFETLQGLRSEAELRVALPEGMYDSLAAAAAERAAAVAERRAVLGRVREREAPPGAAAAPTEAPSAAGRPLCYPPAALQAGLAWPAGVEGGRREEWLSEADFARLFGGLGWAEYCALPGWKRERLRKAAGMF